MKNITPLLQQLADKLNTTVSYLWNIEVHQALLNGVYNIIIFIIVAIAGIAIYKIHKGIMKTDCQYDDNDGIRIIMLLAVLAWVIFFIVCICSIPDTLNSFLDPQYWALKDILRNVKQ